MSSQPIGVFDSGLGGLSVVRHLRQQLPHENIVYFGDTARVPYGSKSSRTVQTFALECARYLLRFDPKMLVAACNTASALALDVLQHELPIEVVGVVEPGARAARAHAANGAIAVLGTEATITSGAYERMLVELTGPAQRIRQIACPLFVPIVEEGRDSDDPVVQGAVAGYLSQLKDTAVRVVVLGCTHYPLLAPAIARYLGPLVTIVDSGKETALEVRRRLLALNLANQSGEQGSLRCFVSDNPPRFRTVGARFLEEPVVDVEPVLPEDYVSQALDSV